MYYLSNTTSRPVPAKRKADSLKLPLAGALLPVIEFGLDSLLYGLLQKKVIFLSISPAPSPLTRKVGPRYHVDYM